ncbi:MAG TPA: zinc-binding dehydrogenase [Candidatus Eisenbacteria bacterium]|nr:zinc-binding dehydrogenase [Candidatus Eisenbacteria bacterium]
MSRTGAWYEATGEVLEVGPGVVDLRPGDVVACQGTSACGFCDGCMVGRLERCRNRHLARFLGYFAERVVVNRRNVWRLDGISTRAGVLLEPMGVAMDLVRLAEVEPDSVVVVVGPGPIGIMAGRLARLRGARRLFFVGVTRDLPRFPLCCELGADACIDADAQDPVQAVFELTNGRGADAVIDTATIDSVPVALRMCAFGGRVAFAGESTAVPEEARPAAGEAGPGSVPIDVNWLHLNRLELRGSYAVPLCSLPLGHALLSDGLLDVERLVTHVFPFGDLREALVAVDERRGDVIKAAIEVTP